MYILPGQPKEFANETPMSNHLMQFAVSSPEILPQVATMFSSEYTAFTSLMAGKGLVAKGLSEGYQDKNYRVVGNRKVMWPIEGLDKRKATIVSYTCENTTYPGKAGEVIALTLNTNWFSPYDVLELSDNKTLITVVDDQLPEEDEDGNFVYYVRLNRKSDASYIKTTLLTAGLEVGFVYTNFYEASETAYEKYTFHEWGTSFMTIQRMKWSISGTAKQMSADKYWVSHNGQKLWTTYAEMQMLKRWAQARETQHIMGVGTVDANDTVYLRDMKGREIVSGDGVLNIGNGALKFPYNKLTKKDIENVMSSLRIYSNNAGVNEVAVIAGRKFIEDFSYMLRQEFKISPEVMKEGDGRTKGVNATFSYYELDGVRIMPTWHKWFDDPSRPSQLDDQGYKKLSRRAIFASIGNSQIGMPNIELTALGNRQFKKGTVYGINEGGDGMKTSVDAEHTHILSETGLICRDEFGIAEMYVN